MKKALFVLTTSFVAAHAPAQSQAASAQVGRFQMADVTLSAAPDSPEKTFSRLAILDTATGTVSICDYAYQNAGVRADKREYWWTNGSCGPLVMEKAALVQKIAPIVAPPAPAPSSKASKSGRADKK